MINEALERYKFNNPEAILIRHNENMTYKIIDNKDTYLLRIHTPAEGLDFSLNYGSECKQDFIKGEIDLLKILCNYDKTMFQCPVKNLDGEFITRLSNKELVTVLSWIDGETLVNREIDCELATKIGKMIGKLHNISDKIKDIKRSSYDEEYMNRVSIELKSAYDLNHIDEFTYNTIESVMFLIKETINKEKDRFILIHSDLSKSNIIYNNIDLCPIDFSLSGYGTREMEIAQMIASLNKLDVYDSLINAYENECGYKLNIDYVELFKALSIILYIVIHHNRSYKDESFIRGLKRWCDTIFIPLIDK